MTTQTPTQAYTGPTYFVRSSGNPNVMYEVATEADGTLRCSCPAAIYRPTHPCRHIRSVVNGQCLVAKPKVRRSVVDEAEAIAEAAAGEARCALTDAEIQESRDALTLWLEV